MVLEGLQGGPLGRIHSQQPTDDLHGRLRDGRLIDAKPPCHDLARQAAFAVGVEGEMPAQAGVHDDAEGPGVGEAAVVGLPADDLGRGVLLRPAAGLQQLALPEGSAQPEIHQLDLHGGVIGGFVVLADEDVLQFQIAMDDSDAVKMQHSTQKLLQDVPGFGLLDASSAEVTDGFEELAALDELHGQADVPADHKEALELDDRLVLDTAEDAQLPRQCLLQPPVQTELRRLHQLDGDPLALLLQVLGKLHLAEGASPDGLVKVVPLSGSDDVFARVFRVGLREVLPL